MAARNALLWKITRLRAMTMAEVFYRIQQAVRAKVEKFGFCLAQPVTPTGNAGKIWLNRLPTKLDANLYCSAADRILAGHFNVFALQNAELGFPPNWNRDPKTSIVAPLEFGKTLNYRDNSIVGDIKYLWEPNRHLELVTLAQAWHLSGDKKYADGCRALLDSWFEQCPYPLGPNWTSSLEHSVRLVNWSFVWHLFGGMDGVLFQGDSGQAFRRRWLDSIYCHCHFIAGHFSKYSSANNHLLGEYMGLFIASLTWPCWQESDQWKDKAAKGLEIESIKQNAPDGVNLEQATWYHHEVADMLLLCGLIGRANGVEFSAQYWSQLEHMLEFIAGIMDAKGNVPMIGDSDDAVMVRFSREADFNVYQSLLASGAVLFSRADFKDKSMRFDDKSRWLLGDEAADQFDQFKSIDDCTPLKTAFPDGGYYVMGEAWGTAREISMVVDVAPLGYLSIAAHGHADALAFTLSLGGQEMLIDPGTYAYHTQKLWRDYFRGTSAHNTLRVDGIDQSVIGGNFMWMKHANATLEHWQHSDDADCILGRHDGYMRLNDPLLHRRKIELDKRKALISIVDTLECKGKHQVEIHWHCHEDSQVSIEDSVVKVARSNASLLLKMNSENFSVRLAHGEDNPPLGWVSRSFDSKVPVTTIVWSGEIDSSCDLETSMQIIWI